MKDYITHFVILAVSLAMILVNPEKYSPMNAPDFEFLGYKKIEVVVELPYDEYAFHDLENENLYLYYLDPPFSVGCFTGFYSDPEVLIPVKYKRLNK